METYFVVLQLPGSGELRFTEGYSPENFWKYAAANISKGRTDIVSIRADTGISEDVRDHNSKRTDKFETYLLFYLMLSNDEAKDKKAITRKICDLLQIANYEMVVEANDNFQLVARDYLELTDRDITGHYFGGTHLSA
jgi:hypothetical protein